MKRNKFALICASLLALGAASCSDSFLDKEVDLTLDVNNVFSNFDATKGFQANLYGYLPDAFDGYNNTQNWLNDDCMTDNAIDYWAEGYYHNVCSDSYNATNHPFSNKFWSRDYNGIRACNQFIKNARMSVVGNAEKSGDDNRLYDRWIAEAKVLRAILHFELICWFGDVSIVAEDENGEPIILEPSTPIPARVSAAEGLKWVADECEKYKNDLPFRYSNEEENWGRINGAVAYALRSRALLYRASALNNPTNDQSWWRQAADAALEFISANQKVSNPYRLYVSDVPNPETNYYDCFTSDPTHNNEYILSRSVWYAMNVEMANSPVGFKNGAYGYLNPTQNLVDAYETRNGLAIDKDPTYNDQNPYANRDPRLEQTIFHHGSVWGQDTEVRTVNVNKEGEIGADVQEGNGGTCTGYYSKKYVHNIYWTGDRRTTSAPHACPIFRYGEILLNAAEALNEVGNSQAASYVDQVRERVGMPSLAGLSQSELRERIRNERRIELVFENHRYFDERRWKLFDSQTEASETSLPRYKQIYNFYGVTVREGTAQVFNYGAADKYNSRVFVSPKNYTVPIPYSEIVKTGLIQTPGWEY